MAFDLDLRGQCSVRVFFQCTLQDRRERFMPDKNAAPVARVDVAITYALDGATWRVSRRTLRAHLSASKRDAMHL